MRYILFGGDHYYPSGGAADLLEVGDSVDDLEASKNISNKNVDWWHIYDTVDRVTVAYGYIDNNGDLENLDKEVLTWTKLISDVTIP